MNRFSRREVFEFLAGGVAVASLANDLRGSLSTLQYTVGVGRGNDPYATAQRAINFCGSTLPTAAIAGKNVVIKPNLVVAKASTTWVTTDPQVVRAVVDFCLEGGAAQVYIAEQSGLAGGAPPWAACGYSPLFDNYQSSVHLLDLGQQPYVLTPIQHGYAYRNIYLSQILLDPATVIIDVAKMKTHAFSKVTLGVKNFFGLWNSAVYRIPTLTGSLPRGNQHELSMDGAIVDMHLAVQPLVTIIDGMVSLENGGPTNGNPKATNIVLASANALAADRAAVQFMGIDPRLCIHLAFASSKLPGPSGMTTVSLVGDDSTPMPFAQAQEIYPLGRWPDVSPATIAVGQTMAITATVYTPSTECKIEIIRNDEVTPSNGPTVLRTLVDWQPFPVGASTFQFDGLDGSGTPLPPGEYQVRQSFHWLGVTQLPRTYIPGLNHTVQWFTVF